MNVLIIEDDQLQVKFIRHVLSSVRPAAFRLDAATRLQEAFDRLATQPFDVVLLDLQLPDSHGLDTFVEVITAHPDIPIVVLTGVGNEERAIEAVRRGAQDYLVKGEFQEGMLVRSLRFAIERNRRLRAEHQMLEAQERERKRLARELHDGVIQSLSSLRLQLQMLAGETRSTDRPTSASLTRLAGEAFGAIDDVRRVCRDLHPAILEMRDLGDALVLFGKRVQTESGLTIKVVDRCRGKLSWQAKHHLYRVFQEAIRNAVRHAGASCVSVEFSTRSDKLVLEIRDNGQGFDVAAVEHAGDGFGLTSIRERAGLLGGRASIDSQLNQGTIIGIEVPAGRDFTAKERDTDITTAPLIEPTIRETVTFSAGDTLCGDQMPEVNDADPRHVGR